MVRAFELDGVLHSQINIYQWTDYSNYLRQIEELPRANFVPEGDYIIVSSRHIADYESSVWWVRRNLKTNPPKKIVLSRSTEDRVEYLLRVLKEEGVTTFVDNVHRHNDLIRASLPDMDYFTLQDLLGTV